VCGLAAKTLRTVCCRVSADDPVAAYLRAWEWCDSKHGSPLLLAAVHPGDYEALPAGAFADPWIHDEGAMRLKAREEWGVRD
jgi:hypothetical protein